MCREVNATSSIEGDTPRSRATRASCVSGVPSASSTSSPWSSTTGVCLHRLPSSPFSTFSYGSKVMLPKCSRALSRRNTCNASAGGQTAGRHQLVVRPQGGISWWPDRRAASAGGQTAGRHQLVVRPQGGISGWPDRRAASAGGQTAGRHQLVEVSNQLRQGARLRTSRGQGYV
jgi:hypothetical protein